MRDWQGIKTLIKSSVDESMGKCTIGNNANWYNISIKHSIISIKTDLESSTLKTIKHSYKKILNA